ncbi:tRNA (N6-threonylcarbamoyladenosine(37)-N6)-methyltransferase TrmO [Aureimonas endophytica]|nr:tRNA (N6-threonylcarbamoyladenosine(37)-N6)-methyltransferase TrmO [Aureimonas endophytica]
MSDSAADLRPGETSFAEAATDPQDAHLRFIGLVRSPWTERALCPKNLREARERRRTASVEIAPAFRLALSDLEAGQWVHLLSWLDRARRDLALQRPRHADGARGTFSLRSPVRPNPIGLHLVRIEALDRDSGHLVIDAIDLLDGTPLLDLKPFLPSVDIPPADGA